MSDSLLQLYLKNRNDKLENEKEEKSDLNNFFNKNRKQNDYDKEIIDLLKLEPSSTSIEEKKLNITCLVCFWRFV